MYNITDGILEDVEGAAHTVVYNGAKIVQVPQLGYALSLDGKDDWVDTGRYSSISFIVKSGIVLRISNRAYIHVCDNKHSPFTKTIFIK